MRTDQPCACSKSTMCEPISPAPPVTSARSFRGDIDMNYFVNSSSLFSSCACALSRSERERQKTEEKCETEIERDRPPIVRTVSGKEAKRLMSAKARPNWERNKEKELSSCSTRDNTERAGSKT